MLISIPARKDGRTSLPVMVSKKRTEELCPWFAMASSCGAVKLQSMLVILDTWALASVAKGVGRRTSQSYDDGNTW